MVTRARGHEILLKQAESSSEGTEHEIDSIVDRVPDLAMVQKRSPETQECID